MILDLAILRQAASDFRYLLDRGYPRAASLSLVGNRYQLPRLARQLLHRGVFASAIATARRHKFLNLRAAAGKTLAVDGHNVLITLEAGFRGLPLVLANDGCIRDVAEISKAYRPGPVTDQALKLLAAALKKADIAAAMVLYDAPLRKSGELARATREVLEHAGVPGEARAVPVPERELLAFPGVIATSDTQLIDAREELVDLAGEVIRSHEALSAGLITLLPD